MFTGGFYAVFDKIFLFTLLIVLAILIIRSIVRNLIPYLRAKRKIPKEKKDIQKVVMAVLNEYDRKGDPSLPQCSRYLRPDIINFISKLNLSEVRDLSSSISKYAHTIIANVLSRHLTSGKHHYYRGELTSTGMKLLEIYIAVLEWGVKNNQVSPEERANEIEEINRQIRLVG